MTTVTSPLENLSGSGQPLRKEAPDGGSWRVVHELRNRGEYEGDLYVDERLLADLIVAGKAVASALLPAL